MKSHTVLLDFCPLFLLSSSRVRSPTFLCTQGSPLPPPPPPPLPFFHCASYHRFPKKKGRRRRRRSQRFFWVVTRRGRGISFLFWIWRGGRGEICSLFQTWITVVHPIVAKEWRENHLFFLGTLTPFQAATGIEKSEVIMEDLPLGKKVGRALNVILGWYRNRFSHKSTSHFSVRSSNKYFFPGGDFNALIFPWVFFHRKKKLNSFHFLLRFMHGRVEKIDPFFLRLLLVVMAHFSPSLEWQGWLGGKEREEEEEEKMLKGPRPTHGGSGENFLFSEKTDSLYLGAGFDKWYGKIFPKIVLITFNKENFFFSSWSK